MKPLLIIFMLCGKPYYVVGHDEYGYFNGLYDAPAPVSIKSRVLEMFRDKDTTFKLKQSVEDLLGGVCV